MDLLFNDGYTVTLIVIAFVDVLVSPLLLNFLRRRKFWKTKDVFSGKEKSRNKYYYDHLKETLDTPSSFGALMLMNIVLTLILSTFTGINLNSFVCALIVSSTLLGVFQILESQFCSVS